MKIRVQMPTGTGSVSVAGQSYTADDSGIVVVENPEHVAPLVASGGQELGDEETGAVLSGLHGSSSLPPMIDVPGGEQMQLGELVRQTHARTGVSSDEWNNLPQAVRDILLGYQLATIRGEVVSGEELRTALERIDELETLLAAQKPEQEQEQEQKPEQEKSAEKPNFEAMTKAKISEWVVANGGEAIAPGDHPSHVAAAEAHWAGMQKA